MGRRDEGEFVAFAEACRPWLRRTAYLMCGDWERAADITQEALVRRVRRLAAVGAGPRPALRTRVERW